MRWTVKRVGKKWMATGSFSNSNDTYTFLSNRWREAAAFAVIAAYGTRTAFWAMYSAVENSGTLPDYYMRGVGERVPKCCTLCASS
jgi:hypothetical protein